MKKSILFSLLCLLLLGTSCVSQRNSGSYLVEPDQVRLEVNMQDLECLGTMDVEIEYKKYGLITKIYTVNGEKYDPRHYQTTSLARKNWFDGLFMMDKALYKVHEQYPEADYVLPTFHKKDVQYMLGGRIIKETLTVKAYKIK